MKLGEAISAVEDLIAINGFLSVTEEMDRIRGAFFASHTYEEGAEVKTESGNASFVIIHYTYGNFQPSEVCFEARDKTRSTKLKWKWNGGSFYLIEENGRPVNPSPTVESLGS